jgi:hypothetical protein
MSHRAVGLSHLLSEYPRPLVCTTRRKLQKSRPAGRRETVKDVKVLGSENSLPPLMSGLSELTFAHSTSTIFVLGTTPAPSDFWTFNSVS